MFRACIANPALARVIDPRSIDASTSPLASPSPAYGIRELLYVYMCIYIWWTLPGGERDPDEVLSGPGGAGDDRLQAASVLLGAASVAAQNARDRRHGGLRAAAAGRRLRHAGAPHCAVQSPSRL
eukprot:936417-Pyramimonas_sp.AAC.2